MVKGRKKSKKSKSKINIQHDKIYLLLGVLVILFGLYNIVQTASFSNLFDEKMDEAKEAASPAELELVLLTDSACSDCFDIQAVVDSIKGSHVNITSEKELNFNSAEARDLIQKYGIDKVPTVLLFGETDKANVRDMEEADDALVFTSQVPPYTDASSGRILGRVSATLITDSSCTNCYDIEQILAGITQTGISIVSREDIDRSEAASLISKYSIDALPALILSKDFEVYGPDIVASWANFGSVESDAFVTRLKNPPYVDLIENRIVGLVKLTILGDATCEVCYDPNQFHKPILARMGIVFEDEVQVDISSVEGQAFVEKYSIIKVPTIILEGDMDTYAALVNAWRGVGTVEEDGAYVFRQVEVSRQPYVDLETGVVVQP